MTHDLYTPQNMIENTSHDDRRLETCSPMTTSTCISSSYSTNSSQSIPSNNPNPSESEEKEDIFEIHSSITNQPKKYHFESDWIETLDPRKTALELIKNTTIRKMLEENGYQPIEHDLRKSTRTKRKPISLYNTSALDSQSRTIMVKDTPSIEDDDADDNCTPYSHTIGNGEEDPNYKTKFLKQEEKYDFTQDRKKSRGYSFEERLEELQFFLLENGHTKVPYRYPPNPSLGYWVSSVRYNYKRLQKGLKLKMDLNLEQIQILSSMPGWVWCAK